MDSQEYHLQTLYQLGLTQNQAKLYLALLSLGKCTAGGLAKETGLARQEVYRVLQELFDGGLVEKTVNNPTDFQAVEIHDGISVLMLRKARQLEQIQQRLERLVLDYNTEKTVSPQGEFKFQLIPAKKLANAQREKMMERAKESIQLITNTRRFSQGIPYFFSLCEQRLKSKLSVRIIVTMGEEASEVKNVSERLKRLESYPNFSIRFMSETKANLLMIDKTEALLTLYPKMDLGGSPLLWTNHPELLAIYQDYFEGIWKKAQAIPLGKDLIDIDI